VIGYSQRVVQTNRKADSKNVGVQLGRFCISREIPVSDVMEFFGVTKQTVYNWFAGKYEPGNLFTAAITEYLKRAR
jgi:hypothetical protein